MLNNLRGLNARGYDVAALISGAPGDLADKLKSAGIPYYVGDLDLFSPLDLGKMVRKVLRLAIFLGQHRFDIVQYYLFPTVIMARIAAWLADVPLCFSMSTGPYALESPLPHDIENKTVWMDSKVIATCEYTRRLYVAMGIAQDKVDLTCFGRDPSYFDPTSADGQKFRRVLNLDSTTPLVGMIAYFYGSLPAGPWTPPHLQNRSAKGHETLIHAARLVLEKKGNVKFVFVGKGWGTEGEKYEIAIKDMVRQLGLDRAVLFAGFQSDIPNVLAALDIVTFCSLSENLGGTSEALFMARPAIASRVGGMVDTVRHEQTGLLVPPDNPTELARAILTLLDDPEKAQQLGRNGRELMLREFTLEKTIDYLDDLYQASVRTLLRKKSRRTHPARAYYYRVHISAIRFMNLAIPLTRYLWAQRAWLEEVLSPQTYIPPFLAEVLRILDNIGTLAKSHSD